MKKDQFIRICLVFAGVLVFLITSSKFSLSKDSEDTIAIGLLISDIRLQEARRGAELAVQKANQDKQLNGKIVKLITRSMEGPWGTGAKQTVDLVFNQKVWAIIGSHDGRNAHLAEQVIAKTQVSYISAWAGDPSLYQAYVPWYFSMVPNDIQQARALVQEIYQHKKYNTVAVLSDQEYDAETAINYFKEEASRIKAEKPIEISYSNTGGDIQELLKKIENSKCEAVILFGKSRPSLELIKAFQKEKLNLAVYGTLAVLGENPLQSFDLPDFENTTIIDAVYWESESGKAFIDKYKEGFGTMPGAQAAYAYDAIQLIIETIKKSGFDREIFREALKEINFQGITGSVQFDEFGNRIQPASLVKIYNGLPRALKK